MINPVSSVAAQKYIVGEQRNRLKKRNQKRNSGVSTITFTTFWDFLMIKQSFLSRQVKRNVIISNKLVYDTDPKIYRTN